ncbi:MAG: COX15/CtaA family protein [Pirellulales bacterium]
MNATPRQIESESPWPHRWAVALVCATFPMIWIGSLVTTYGAGMAVPDWPNTYGYNLFLYPWQTWIYGPWKLFIEHGHRLFGTLVGMITIGFLVSTWWCQRRPLLRWLGVAALAGVLFQGLLGGLRVVANEVQLAQIHGCVGPAFFAFTVALAAVTSRRWRLAEAESGPGLSAIGRLALVTTLLAFGQIVLGSLLRHLPQGAQPDDFRLALFFHLAVAGLLVAHIVALAARTLHARRAGGWLLRPALGLVLLVLLQLGLGAATWVTKYGWPAWMSSFDFAARYVPTADGAAQAWITTAHVAIGSLILGTSLLVALRSARLTSRRWRARQEQTLQLEAAR